MSGWIKLYRSIRDHWVFQDENYFRAWCIILMKVNHEPNKVLIHGKLYECERGQSLLSLQSWVEEFGITRWTVQKVRTFFKLLQEDEMIKLEGMRKTTRLTVCNYDTYQDSQQTANKQPTSSQQAANKQPTSSQQQYKNYKNDKEPKEPKEKKPAASRSVSENDFIDQVIKEFSAAHGDYEIITPGKERAAAGRLVKKYREKYPEANSQETVQGLRAYFDQCVKIKDDWYRQNMSLPLITSKFNEINKILKNGSSKGKSNSISDDFKKGLLERMLS
jgi:hypothetical protein